MNIDGVLVVDKSAGMTSHDVVNRVRRAAGTRRVGHAGTLDQDVTGVLIVCIGSATRLVEYLMARGKQYDAVCKFGITTSTEDSSGEVLSDIDASHISEGDVRGLLPAFIGEIKQIPPMVSAVHHNGKRLYELARDGQTVVREARSITIDSIEITGFDPSRNPTVRLEIQCGKGTYIRTLCADIGQALGVGAHMAFLRRTSVGPYLAEDAVSVDTLSREIVLERLIPSALALPWFPSVLLKPEEELLIQQGKSISGCGVDEEVVCLVGAHSRLCALAALRDGALYPFKVFPPDCG